MAASERSTEKRRVRPGEYRGATFEVGEQCKVWAPNSSYHRLEGTIDSFCTHAWVRGGGKLYYRTGYFVSLVSGETIFLLPGEVAEPTGEARHLKLVPKRAKVFDEGDYLHRAVESMSQRHKGQQV